MSDKACDELMMQTANEVYYPQGFTHGIDDLTQMVSLLDTRIAEARTMLATMKQVSQDMTGSLPPPK
jgi:hypothetical protein